METRTPSKMIFTLLLAGLLLGLGIYQASAEELCDGFEDAPFCQGDSDHDYYAPSTDDCVTDWNRSECEVRCYDEDGNAIECPDYVTSGNPSSEGASSDPRPNASSDPLNATTPADDPAPVEASSGPHTNAQAPVTDAREHTYADARASDDPRPRALVEATEQDMLIAFETATASPMGARAEPTHSTGSTWGFVIALLAMGIAAYGGVRVSRAGR